MRGALFGLRATGLALAAGLAVAHGASVWAQDAKTPEAPASATAPAAVTAVAAPADPIVPPSDPDAKAAFDVLDRNCARCHQVGKLISRERPAKQFGNVLK